MEETVNKDIENLKTEFQIDIDQDKMVVFLTCSANGAKDETIIEAIQNRMRLQKISAKPNVVLIKEAIGVAVASDKSIAKMEIARGVEPEQPEDGEAEWTGDYFNESYYIDPVTKKIDFKQKLSDPNVEKDQLLVKVKKPKPGKNGRNVYGNAIIVKSPRDVHIKSGKNVYWNDELSGYCAFCSGRVKMRGKTLDIEPIFYARNGVNTEIGNINHNGPVVVDGEVDPEFKIEATGDIEIRDIVYACDIVCGGDLVAKEGINSNIEKRITVEGNVAAKYLMNAVVKSKGDITVGREIYQCQVEATGEVNCTEGRIIGGEVYATKGLTVGEAGSRGNVKTLIVVGVDKELQARRHNNSEEIKRLKEVIKQLESAHHKCKANLHLLNDEQKEQMTTLVTKQEEGREEIKRLEQDNRELYEIITKNADARITIMEIVYSGTILRIADHQMIIDTAMKGPFYAFWDRTKGEIALASLAVEEPVKEEAIEVEAIEEEPADDENREDQEKI